MHSQTMSELIHEAYQASVRISSTSFEFIQNLYKILNSRKEDVIKEDMNRLENFIQSLKL